MVVFQNSSGDGDPVHPFLKSQIFTFPLAVLQLEITDPEARK